MNLLLDGIAWILDPANWTGVGSIPERIGQHLVITAIVLVIASLIALPVGGLVGHTGRGKELAVTVSGGLRALPTLGVLTLFALWLGIGLQAPVIALVILALPPLLAGAYAGLESVDRRTVDAARAMGMRESQIVGQGRAPAGHADRGRRHPLGRRSRSSRPRRSPRTSPTSGSAGSSSPG